MTARPIPDWLEARLVRITDPQDARIAAYRDIREKDLTGRQGRFVAEGKVVLNVLFSSARFRAESVLVLENRLAGLEAALAACPSDVPVYTATAPVMDAIAGFHVHRGVLAIGRRDADLSLPALLAPLPPRALVVVLCGIANHDNMGAIFRNAAAFAADGVILDETCCDPLYRKAIRVSVGAALKVPFARAGAIGDIVSELEASGFELLALSPAGSESIYEIGVPERAALLLGTEGEGLPGEIMQRLKTARIPMSPDFDSLNVATASGIALSRFARFA